jgi:hypothetical protein
MESSLRFANNRFQKRRKLSHLKQKITMRMTWKRKGCS